MLKKHIFCEGFVKKNQQYFEPFFMVLKTLKCK